MGAELSAFYSAGLPCFRNDNEMAMASLESRISELDESAQATHAAKARFEGLMRESAKTDNKLATRYALDALRAGNQAKEFEKAASTLRQIYSNAAIASEMSKTATLLRSTEVSKLLHGAGKLGEKMEERLDAVGDAMSSIQEASQMFTDVSFGNDPDEERKEAERMVAAAAKSRPPYPPAPGPPMVMPVSMVIPPMPTVPQQAPAVPRSTGNRKGCETTRGTPVLTL